MLALIHHTHSETPHTRLGVAILLALTLLWPASTLASEPTLAAAGVRTNDARIAAALRSGMEGSSTFLALVKDIERHDGIVYVEEGRCRGRARACLLIRVTRVASFRILFIYVDMRGLGGDLVPLVGHELTHAVETLRERSVDTGADMHHLFARIGLWSSNRMAFETAAAISAGADIDAELRQRNPARRGRLETAARTARGRNGRPLLASALDADGVIAQEVQMTMDAVVP